MACDTFHAGLIAFQRPVSRQRAIQAATALSRLGEFKVVWVRRVADSRWAIEFLAGCNGTCRGRTIGAELEDWMDILNAHVPTQQHAEVSVSADVTVLKWPKQSSCAHYDHIGRLSKGRS